MNRKSPQKRTFANFKKADWIGFKEHTEGKFGSLEEPTDVDRGKKLLHDIINKASKKFIPQGRIKTIYPERPPDIAKLMDLSNNLRKTITKKQKH